MEPPTDQLESAYRRGDTKECAWRRPEALRLAESLAARGAAIIQGEAWMILGGQLYVLRHERDEGFFGWKCLPQPEEPWLPYVQRCLRIAQAAIGDDEPLRRAEVPPAASVYYNTTWLTEADLPSSCVIDGAG